MRERKDHERVHRRMWELLPWYVNGTLAQPERQGVEAHLAECLRCQEEERACRRTAEAVLKTGDAAPSPHPVQFQRLLARVEEHERAGRPPGRRRPGAALVALLAGGPRPLRAALIAQAAVILLLVGLQAWQALRPSPSAGPAPAGFTTLSDPGPPPAPAPRLRIMFSPGTTEREIRELLLAIRGEIKAGPSPIGLYTVEVPAGSDPLAAVLTRLRSEPQVTFAEPAAGTGLESP
jgi:hypothetical protein